MAEAALKLHFILDLICMISLPLIAQNSKEKGLKKMYHVTFHIQQECVYDFPSLSLATRASADMSELVFKQE